MVPRVGHKWSAEQSRVVALATDSAWPHRRCRRQGLNPWLGRPPETGMATHSCVLVGKIPWTGEPGRLQSIRSQRVRHDWSDLAHTVSIEVKRTAVLLAWQKWKWINIPKTGKGVDKLELSYIAGRNTRTLWQYCVNLNICLLYDPPFLLCIYTREVKIYAHKNKSVYKILMHNSPKLETIFMSVNRTINKNFHVLSIL